MKKIVSLVILAVALAYGTQTISAQERVRINQGVYLVSYGNTWVIEDDNRQNSISISIAQEGIDRKNDERMYKVVCNGITKKAVNWGLKKAIEAGINAAGLSGGWTLVGSAVATAADMIYNEWCDKWKEEKGY